MIREHYVVILERYLDHVWRRFSAPVENSYVFPEVTMRRSIYRFMILSALCLPVFAQTAAVSGLNGLGASTMTCVDRDGDGYGTGPGCQGPDVDDTDATIHTAAQGITKYGSLTALLNHLGYTPLRQWFIATNGNDSTCLSGKAPAGISLPCLTFMPISSNLVAGDVVIYRAGTYTSNSQRFTPTVNGTSSNPIIAMGYPGESALFNMTSTSSAVNIIDRSYVVIDNMKFTTASGGCISGGVGLYGLSSNTFHDITVRHVEAYECHWGIIVGGFDNLLIEDSVFHDESGEHGIYIGAKGDLLSSNATIRRVITYNNPWNGVHVNGNVVNLVQDQNISYSNGLANYDWQNGVHNSFFRSNLSFAAGNTGLNISVYKAKEGDASCGLADGTGTQICTCSPGNLAGTCPHDQTGNLIENFTHYGTIQGQGGMSTVDVPAIWVARQFSCTSPTCLAASLGNNTFRNIIADVNTDGSNHYQPIVFSDASTGWPQSSTFDSILAWESDSSHMDGAIGYGPYPSSFGHAPYSCSTAASVGITIMNCLNQDPKFVAADPSWWNQISSFNFQLLSASPAVHRGTTVGIPLFDLVGHSFASPPSIGALEQSASSPPPTITVTTPVAGTTLSGSVAVTATASGTLPVTAVQFQVDGAGLGSPVPVGPLYTVTWDTTKVANGPHSLTAIATDSGGNIGTTTISVTISNASVAPAISAVAAGSITSSATTINWTTDKPADSQVAYGTTSAYGFTTSLATTLVTTHAVTLSGLSASTTYHYEVLSKDAQSNLARSTDFSFTTAAASIGSGQVGWQDLPNTQMLAVCPPNGFGGINYAFKDKCAAVLAAWNSAVPDTKRNHLIIWGGGHVDYNGNEIYSLDVGSSPASMTRITNPSDYTQNVGCPDANVSDGTPVSRHTYGSLVYLPQGDRMFAFGGSKAPCGSIDSNTWTLDLSVSPPVWHAMDPVSGYNPSSQFSTLGPSCAYDPTSVTSTTESVICNWGSLYSMLRFTYDDVNKSIKVTQLTNVYASAIPSQAGTAIDSKRKLMFFVGADQYGGLGPKFMAVDISSGTNWAVQDWTSKTTGCSGLINSAYPGLAYDPVLDRIVGWPNAGGTVYVFNPDTKTCIAQGFPNGPSATATTAGSFGHFQYFPALDVFVAVSGASQDAFLLRLNSSTGTPPASCDLNGDGVANVVDVQIGINQVLGISPCGSADLYLNGQCDVTDVQRLINASLGGACVIGP